MVTEEYYNRTRLDLLPYIPINCRKILDCGCGFGMLGAALKARGPCWVTGVEKNPRAAAEARKRLDVVYEQDVAEPVGESAFDCIIYADVLEHLVDPWSVLRSHATLLVPGGYVVMSVPNVRHFTVGTMLYGRGHWRYADSGIMDRTHLRFFTLNDLKDMIHGAGLQIDKVGSNREPWTAKTLLVRLTMGWFVPDCLTVQWIVRGRLPAAATQSDG